MEWRRHILDYVVNCQHRHESIRERKVIFLVLLSPFCYVGSTSLRQDIGNIAMRA